MAGGKSRRRRGWRGGAAGAAALFAAFFCLPACLAAFARRAWIRRVSSFWRSGLTNVYSAVMLTSAWPAIFEASMALPPTSCRQVMLARPRLIPVVGAGFQPACLARQE